MEVWFGLHPIELEVSQKMRAKNIKERGEGGIFHVRPLGVKFFQPILIMFFLNSIR